MAELPGRDDAIDAVAPDKVTGLSADAVPLLVDEKQLPLAERCSPVTATASAVGAPLDEFVAPRRMHFEPDRRAVHDGAAPVGLKDCSRPTQAEVFGIAQVQADKTEKAMPPGDLEGALQCESTTCMISACNEADQIMESAHGDACSFAQQLHENLPLEIEKNVLLVHNSPNGAVTYDSGSPFKVERTDNQAIEASIMGQDGYRLAVDASPEEMHNLATEDLSPVDSVINNMFKVSIQQNVVSCKEHKYGICGSALENFKHSKSQSLDQCQSLLDTEETDTLSNKTSQGIEPSQESVEVTERQSCGKSDKLHLIEEDCLQYTEKDAIGDNNDNANVENDNEMKEACGDLNEEVEEEPEDNASSSSTSTLSFSLSHDVEEANNFCHSNNFNQQFDMEPESECEEGELKESPSQRKKIHTKKIAMAESSDEEEGIKEPPLSKSKTKDLPRVPKVSVILQPHHTMVPVGLVLSIVGVNLIVEGIEGQQPLSEGSILWLTGQQSPLGAVDELFGPVKKPFYVVRYNEESEVPKEAKEGAQVSYVRDFVEFVLNNSDLYAKGYDNVGEEGEELSDSEVYFSDDEKEAEYKCSRSTRKRGSLESRALDNTASNNTRLHEERKTQGKRSTKDKRNQRIWVENNRTSLSNNEFPRGPSKHQMPLAQRRQCKRDLPFRAHQGDRELPSYQHGMNDRVSSHSRGGMKPTQKCNDRQFEDLSSVMHALPEKPVGIAQRKSLTLPQRCVSMSDHVCVGSKKYQAEDSPRSFSNDVQPTLSNHSSQATSREPLSPQKAIPMDQAPGYLQGTSHKLPMQGTFGSFGSSPQQHQGRSVYSPLQSRPQPRPQPQDLHRPYCFMQPALPQQDPLTTTCNQGQMSNQSPLVPPPQAWHMSSPHAVPQLSGVQHPQISAGVAGQVSQVTGIGYSMPMINNSVLHSVADTGQGMLPIPPVFQQQASLQTQFPSLGANQGSTSVSSHVNLQIANQVQATHVNGYPLGVQSTTDFSAPVLGIPVGRAEISPSNYGAQNQQYFDFNQRCASYLDGPPLRHGVPDNPGSMQPPSLPPGFSAVPGHQQRSHQDGFGQNPYWQRPPPHQGSSCKSRRF